jgi:UDP-MurNAc hydroxylase
MRITSIGHAGLRLDTAGGSILCDPWSNPAYLESWFPFPANDSLAWDQLGECDYLYVSHLHRDHFDPVLLARHVRKSARVLLPDYRTSDLEEALRSLGFRHIVRCPNGTPVDLDGVRVMIEALVSPADGPIGDSALAVDDGTARVYDMNDARPPDTSAIERFGPIDAHLLQFSGAIWFPMVYDFPKRAKEALAQQKRGRQLDRARRYVEAVGARYVVPFAGPPCFLDEDLFELNDFDGSETNIFPDQPVFLEHLVEHGITGGQLLVPGSVMTLLDGRCEVSHPGPDPMRPFTHKRAYLEDYAARMRPAIELRRARRAALPRTPDLLGRLKAWWEPLLEVADYICDGVGGPVLLDLGEDRIVIDFPQRTVRLPEADEKYRYRYRVERDLVEDVMRADEVDWVNSLFLSLRFRASRIGPYNEYIYTFFKCLSPERIYYAEGWYADRSGETETIALDGWQVQKRCPHLKADLSRFGTLEGDDVLVCQMHGFRFDLTTGRCLNSHGYHLQATCLEPASPQGHRTSLPA